MNNWNLTNIKASKVKTFLPNSDVRVFSINLPTTMQKVLDQAMDYCPEIDRKIIKFQYQDDENDWISCDTLDEFKELLLWTQNSEILKLKILLRKPEERQSFIQDKIEIPEEIKPEETIETIKEELCCNKCYEQTKSQNPINGNIYRCAECEDFDLCQQCFDKRTEFHPNHRFKEFIDNKFTKIVSTVEIKKPEPPIEPKVEVDPYETQKSLLEEMGFSDKDLNLEFLKKHNGNLQEVVKDLITQQ